MLLQRYMDSPHDILKRIFGFDHFRGVQEEVVERVLAGQHTLAVMPTGAGKSLCYQLPAVAREGTALVVSPLIALMHDQIRRDHLVQHRLLRRLNDRGVRVTRHQGDQPGMFKARVEDLFAAGA